MRYTLDRKRAQFNLYTEKLKILSPLYRLSGGYSYVRDDEDKPVKSIKTVAAGDKIKITVTDGDINATVDNVQSST